MGALVHEVERALEATSVVLGGEPGAGKTYLLAMLRDRHGWPLCDLHGLEAPAELFASMTVALDERPPSFGIQPIIELAERVETRRDPIVLDGVEGPGAIAAVTELQRLVPTARLVITTSAEIEVPHTTRIVSRGLRFGDDDAPAERYLAAGIERRRAPALDAATRGSIAEASGGSPLRIDLVTTLWQLEMPRGDLPTHLAGPLDDLIGEVLDRLALVDPDARSALDQIAWFRHGLPRSQRLIAASDEMLARLERWGLLIVRADAARFVPAPVRAVVRRRQIHERARSAKLAHVDVLLRASEQPAEARVPHLVDCIRWVGESPELDAALQAAAVALYEPLHFGGSFPLHLHVLDRALRATRGELDATGAMLLLHRARSRSAIGWLDEALADCARVADRARALGDDGLLSDAEVAEGLARVRRGEPSTVVSLFERVVERRARSGDVTGALLGQANVLVARAEAGVGDHTEAFETLADREAEAGLVRLVPIALRSAALCHFEHGRLAAAEHVLDRASRLRSDASASEKGNTAMYLGWVRLAAGSPDGAAVPLQQAERTLSAIGERPTLALAHALLAYRWAAVGEVTRAERSMLESRGLLLGMRLDILIATADLLFGHVDLAKCREAATSGRTADAWSYFDDARRKASSSRVESVDWRLAMRGLQQALTATEPIGRPPVEDHLVIAHDGSFFRTADGTIVQLARRRAARAILLRLARAHAQRRGHSVPIAALIEAGWPDERIMPRAAMNRLHVALSTLRRLGLTTLQSHERGYRLDPVAPVVLHSA